MSTAAKHDIRTLHVEPATPKNESQRRMAASGVRGFWVEASGHTVVNGMRITKYLVTLLPDGFLRCSCHAGKLGKTCCHKSAVHAHVGSPVVVNRIPDARVATPIAARVTVAAGPQMTFACSRVDRTRNRLASSLDRPRHESAVLVNHTPETFSIYR